MAHGYHGTILNILMMMSEISHITYLILFMNEKVIANLIKFFIFKWWWVKFQVFQNIFISSVYDTKIVFSFLFFKGHSKRWCDQLVHLDYISTVSRWRSLQHSVITLLCIYESLRGPVPHSLPSGGKTNATLGFVNEVQFPNDLNTTELLHSPSCRDPQRFICLLFSEYKNFKKKAEVAIMMIWILFLFSSLRCEGKWLSHCRIIQIIPIFKRGAHQHRKTCTSVYCHFCIIFMSNLENSLWSRSSFAH